MSRERVARFRASIKDPGVRKSVDNAISYRRSKRVHEHDILAFLVKEFGEHASFAEPLSDGSAALDTHPQHSESDSDSDTDESDPAILNPVADAQGEPSGVLNPPAEFQTREISDAEVAAMIERMRSLQVSHLHTIGEGVVIEMPSVKKSTEKPAEIQNAAEPAPSKDSEKPDLKEGGRFQNAIWRVLNSEKKSVRKKADEKTAGTVPMRLESRPSPTRTIFSTAALLTLIGFMSHYLISATESLYGTGIATLLVVIPVAFVFFVKIPIVRYAALLLFLGADLLSIKALHEKEVARISTASLETNPEYQRLKIQYDNLEAERTLINARTHPSLRTQKAEEAKKVSDRMGEIEKTSVVSEQATADRTQANVTLGVRALLLIGAAIFAHALLHYAAGIDFDRWVRKAFGRDDKGPHGYS